MINNDLIYKTPIKNISLKKTEKKKFSKSFDNITKKILKGLNEQKNIFNILSAKYKFNFRLKDLEKFKKFKNIAIIGMGGSILGSEAIQCFLEEKLKKNIYFFDNIDENKIIKFKKKKKSKKTLYIVISKSGNTIETVSNFLYLDVLKKNAKNIIIISEKKNNFLYKLTKKYNLHYVEHKDYIGGRYSVLSEVGIIPAYLMGVNISNLRKNTSKFLYGKNRAYLKENSLKLMQSLKSKKKSSIVFLNYSPRLEKFLFWTQQLIAESLGKKGFGFFPVISNAPKDHHSLLQLYMDGPKDKIFYIFSVNEKSNKKIQIEQTSNYLSFLNNKSLKTIKTAQKNSLIKALNLKKIPFRELNIKKINEEAISSLFTYFFLETAIIGKLSDLDPFNQPAVENIKIFTKKFLK